MMPETDSDPTPSRAAARAILIAGSLGVIAGGLHGIAIWVQRFGLGRFTFHSRDAIWMAPLGTALLFGGLALLGVVPALLLRRRIPTSLVLGVFGFLAVFTVLLPYGEISRWAATLLAVAVGVQFARGARRDPEHSRRRTLRIGAGFAVAMAGLGIGQRAVLAVRQAQGIGALRPAAAGAPSILLIILDTVRGENLSLYGYPRPTFAALEKWAARGVVFDHAIATAPWTLPSHGSLFTGMPSRRIGGGWFEPISDSAPTLAEVLRDRGYRTAGFAANLLYTSYETGLDRGFLEYRDYPLHLLQVLWHSPLVQTVLVKSLLRARSLYAVKKAARRFNLETNSRPGDQYIPAPVITDGFLRWHERLGDRPFFAFLNYFDAHGPYRAAPAYLARFAGSESDRDRYDAAIAYLDSELDRLLSALEARGALERTIVVITSDHGELFGEHKLHGHANAMYLPLLRVPLVFLAPSRIPAGVRVENPVSLRDVPATLLDLAGGGEPGGLPGVSLAGRWDSTRSGRMGSAVTAHVIRAHDINAKGRNAATWLETVLDQDYHYIRSGVGLEELYAWRTDSLEKKNLVHSPSALSIIRRLRARLDSGVRRE